MDHFSLDHSDISAQSMLVVWTIHPEHNLNHLGEEVNKKSSFICTLIIIFEQRYFLLQINHRVLTVSFDFNVAVYWLL